MFDDMKALDEAWNARDEIDSLLDQFEQPVAGESSEYNILCAESRALLSNAFGLKEQSNKAAATKAC